jgi:hypothetical protein
VTLAAALAAPCWAIGAELQPSRMLEVAAIPKLELPAMATWRQNPFDRRPVATGQLAMRRGGDGVFNQNKLKGVVADNSASNLTTGMNVISEGAFAGSSGLPTVIQNSGNNVLIQNSTIVNVQVK